MSPIVYDVTPYDRAGHEAFVKSSWVRGARQPWDALADRLRRPEARCLVANAPGKPDTLYGWAAVDNAIQAVIFAYTRSWPSGCRRRGLMTGLLLEMGFDLSRSTRCLYWTPIATKLAERGYRLIFSPEPKRAAAAA